jgi:hypothetical protein
MAVLANERKWKAHKLELKKLVNALLSKNRKKKSMVSKNRV